MINKKKNKRLQPNHQIIRSLIPSVQSTMQICDINQAFYKNAKIFLFVLLPEKNMRVVTSHTELSFKPHKIEDKHHRNSISC